MENLALKVKVLCNFFAVCLHVQPLRGVMTSTTIVR